MSKKFRSIAVAALALLFLVFSVAGAEIYSYFHIHYASEGTIISDIQNRLLELDYPFEFNEGVYDMELQNAIELFCEVNGIEYDREEDNGITPDIQFLLMEGDAKPYEAEPEKSILDTVKAHLLSTVTVFSIIVPMYLIWFAGIILLVILILIIVAACRRKKAPKGKKGEIKFTVEFEGKTETHSLVLKNKLLLGRDHDTVPLNPTDLMISRKHCEIYCLNGIMKLRDFSANGTTVNGKLCNNAEQILSSGDILKVGEHVITVRF